MLLADNGALVLRIDRAIPGRTWTANLPPPTADLLTRHKSSIAVDLKTPAGVAFIKTLVVHADVVIDPFRPGVLEKLGLGPEILQKINPKIIVGRITGFRRDGKYKDMAGHDINYIAVSGALSLFGRKGEKPLPPANVLGDFAGGGAMLFQGILLALLARSTTGKGQIVEANMVDGSSYLTTFPRLATNSSLWDRPRGENILDGGCPWYDTYETKDGKFIAVGALEPQFFAALLQGLDLDGKGIEERRDDRAIWGDLMLLFTRLFKEKTRAEWEEIFDGTDACVTPVLELQELETDSSREGDQRPAMALSDSPSLALRKSQKNRPVHEGQGEGVEGDGWIGRPLRPGEGGKKVLRQWLGGWAELEFDVENGGLVKKPRSKI